jgi:G3E family GTPase
MNSQKVDLAYTEMGIEKDILTDSDGKTLGDLYELPAGCLCCVVK